MLWAVFKNTFLTIAYTRTLWLSRYNQHSLMGRLWNIFCFNTSMPKSNWQRRIFCKQCWSVQLAKWHNDSSAVAVLTPGVTGVRCDTQHSNTIIVILQ